MRRVPVLVLLCVFSGFFSCAERPQASREGETRLVVVSPALGRIVRDLDLAPLVVGRHAWDGGFPDAPSVGDQAGLDYEILRRLEPTHVLLQWGDRPLPERLTALAQREGWELGNIEILTLDEIGSAVREVASFCGDADATGRAEGLVEELAGALAENDDVRARAGRVAALYGVSPLGIAGPGSFTFEMIERLGADCVPDEGAAFIAMDPEDLRRLDPDTLVFFAPGADEQERRRLREPLERLGLRARVVFVVDEGCLLPSTSMIGAARELGDRLMGLAPLGGE